MVNTKVRNGRPPQTPEPAEPYSNRETSRLPKLRALGNVVALFKISVVRADVALFKPSVSAGIPSFRLRFSPLEQVDLVVFVVGFGFFN